MDQSRNGCFRCVGMTAGRPLREYGMEINLPDVVREVEGEFQRYERALNDNDVAVLDELFWRSRFAVRYGAGEELYGHAAIAGFRVSRQPSAARRRLLRTVVTTYGQDFATACCEFERLESRRRGRQMQAWIRTAEGWRIAAAHVSMVSEGGDG
jgi:hypothetical protein